MSSISTEKRMKRTKSSLLAFKLREVRIAMRVPQRASSTNDCFLDSRDCAGFEPTQLSAVCEPSEPPASVRPTAYSARPPAADTVWVDCFYYGFYMEKAKLPAFQASLRQQHAMQQLVHGKPVASH